ncbi:hypothetical protein [uncultured Roseibium sp.]|uniref:hypothetical protein n=1 Tax=uncultured Roseibium sp. TaxID=1936171 RepID=UPI003216EAC9
MDHGGEACVCLVASRGDTLEFLESSEEILAQATRRTEVSVNVWRHLSRRSLRDTYDGAAFVEIIDDAIAAASLVSQQAAKF